MEKNDLHKSNQDANHSGRNKTGEEETTQANVSNSQHLQAGLGRDRMKNVEDWDESGNQNTARNFNDLRNENLNAANDE